MQKVSMLC